MVYCAAKAAPRATIVSLASRVVTSTVATRLSQKRSYVFYAGQLMARSAGIVLAFQIPTP